MGVEGYGLSESNYVESSFNMHYIILLIDINVFTEYMRLQLFFCVINYKELGKSYIIFQVKGIFATLIHNALLIYLVSRRPEIT